VDSSCGQKPTRPPANLQTCRSQALGVEEKAGMNAKRKVHRSGLTMPINNPRFVNSSWTRGADGFQLDLQESVPQDQKPHARTLVREATRIARQGGGEVEIRINEGYIEADVVAAVWPEVSGLNMGHTRSADEIRLMDECITRMERQRGIRPGTTSLGVSPDSVQATVAAEELVQASSRIRGFGGVARYDYALSLGVEMFVGFDQTFYPRGLGSLIARAHDAGGGASAQLPDTTGSESDSDRAYRQAVVNRKLGGRRGHGNHPAVVEPSTRGLTPPPEEVADARRVLAFWRLLDEQGQAEGMLEGTVVDRYEAARAEELIEWAAACEAMDQHKAQALANAQAQAGRGNQ
jgi:citrate lyase subunit beta/citryl-CoA lyase